MAKQCPDCWNHSLYLITDADLGEVYRCVMCKYTATQTTFEGVLHATSRFKIL